LRSATERGWQLLGIDKDLIATSVQDAEDPPTQALPPIGCSGADTVERQALSQSQALKRR